MPSVPSATTAEAALALEQAAQAVPEDGMVVDDGDANGPQVRQAWTGAPKVTFNARAGSRGRLPR
jgi:hypothetical protein